MTEQSVTNYDDETDNNLLYFSVNGPTISKELEALLNTNQLPNMKSFEEHLIQIYDIYINTTNIAELRYIKHKLNIPNMAGGRSVHIETIHNQYEFDQTERDRYNLLNGYARWTRFNQLHLDDTIRLNKIHKDIKHIVSNTEVNSNTITQLQNKLDNITLEHNQLQSKLKIYEEYAELLLQKYNVLDEFILLYYMNITLLCIFVLFIIYFQLLTTQ
jgi:hypothetical protein